MIPDIDIWRAALLMVKRYGADTAVEAAARADEMPDAGDVEGARDRPPAGGDAGWYADQWRRQEYAGSADQIMAVLSYGLISRRSAVERVRRSALSASRS